MVVAVVVMVVVITQNENGECDVIQLKRKKPMLCYVEEEELRR